MSGHPPGQAPLSRSNGIPRAWSQASSSEKPPHEASGVLEDHVIVPETALQPKSLQRLERTGQSGPRHGPADRQPRPAALTHA